MADGVLIAHSKLYCVLISLYIVSPNSVVSKAWVSPERAYLVVNWKLFFHFCREQEDNLTSLRAGNVKVLDLLQHTLCN